MALGMVKRLLGILRKHRVHGVEQERHDAVRMTRAPNQGASSSAVGGSPLVEQQQQIQPTVPSETRVMMGPAGVQPSWAYDTMDPNGLAGLWNDFLDTNPTNGGWDQLFSELDYLSGPL